MNWSEWWRAGCPRIPDGICHNCKGQVWKFEPHWHLTP